MMRTGQNPEFQIVETDIPSSNRFDLTHDFKFTGRIGHIIPVMCMETLPGDTFDIKAQVMTRFQPLLSPVYHRLDCAIHYFFVPNRILWENWTEFIKGNEAGHAIPQVTIDSTLTDEEKKFLNYFGIPKFPALGGNATNINALPLAAYQRIYNEYYRAQKITPEVNVTLQNGLQPGSITDELLKIRRIGWLHDYFTSALPAPQEQNPVELPMGDVVLKDNWDLIDNQQFVTPVTAAGNANIETDVNGDITANGLIGTTNVALEPNGTLEVNAGTIAEFRRANILQGFLEKLMRAGNRYIEYLQNIWGVRSSDARLQRPEYITGLRAPITISEVLNTTGTEELPQGAMTGHAVGIGEGNAGSFYCEEHGYIIGVYFVTAQPIYQDGLPRHFVKADPINDYAIPEFAHIGEQAIKNVELKAYTAIQENEFGYIPRFSEYKYAPNRVAGDFADGTLQSWTLSRKFATTPTLNTEFIEIEDEDFRERIFAVDDPNTDHILVQCLNMVNARRKLPVFSTPKL